MRIRLAHTAIVSAALLVCTPSPALAQHSEIEGVVVTNQHGQLTIKTASGDQTIMLSPSTRVRAVSGAFGANKGVVSHQALLPGLPIWAEGNMSGGRLVANEVEYKQKDYKTALQINAGVQETARKGEETARREAELRGAYSKMGDWNVRAEKNVYFKTGSAVISPSDKRSLMALASEAKNYKGYVVSVLGYADPRGNSSANERLSNRRAQAVINYLKQSGHLLPGRVLSASAMGEMNIPVDKGDSASHTQARRVTVRVLTSAAHLNP